MHETVTIDRTEYNRLVELAEHTLDVEAFDEFHKKMTTGEEELVPSEFVTRIINGESPLRVWREHRELSQSALSKKSNVNRVQIADIEAGRSKGSIETIKKLAVALDVLVDDLV